MTIQFQALINQYAQKLTSNAAVSTGMLLGIRRGQCERTADTQYARFKTFDYH